MKTALLLSLLFCTTLLNAQDTIRHVYLFNGNFDAEPDGPSLQEIIDPNCSGAVEGAFGTDTINTSAGTCTNGDSANVYMFNPGEGVQYDNSSGLIGGSYTIHVFFKFNTLGGYSRIIDFSNSGSDNGIYLLGNTLNFYPTGNVGPAESFVENIYYLMTFVRDSTTNVITVYVDGVPYTSYDDVENRYTSPNANTPLNFFRDDSIVDCEVKAGSIKYLSISNIPSDSAQVDSIWSNICGIALPVTWYRIMASTQGKNALVNWSTVTESNTAYFSVQHSINGHEFSDIGSVTATGNSTARSDYSFTHFNVSNNTHYYRIKQVDKDNRFSYSPVVKLVVSGDNNFVAFPNPAKSMITISGLSGKGVIRLISIEGKPLIEQKVNAQTLTLNLDKLPPGTYLVRYTDGHHSYVQKVFKQ